MRKSNWIISPRMRGEHTTCLKPPPPSYEYVMNPNNIWIIESAIPKIIEAHFCLPKNTTFLYGKKLTCLNIIFQKSQHSPTGVLSPLKRGEINQLQSTTVNSRSLPAGHRTLEPPHRARIEAPRTGQVQTKSDATTWRIILVSG